MTSQLYWRMLPVDFRWMGRSSGCSSSRPIAWQLCVLRGGRPRLSWRILSPPARSPPPRPPCVPSLGPRRNSGGSNLTIKNVWVILGWMYSYKHLMWPKKGTVWPWLLTYRKIVRFFAAREVGAKLSPPSARTRRPPFAPPHFETRISKNGFGFGLKWAFWTRENMTIIGKTIGTKIRSWNRKIHSQLWFARFYWQKIRPMIGWEKENNPRYNLGHNIISESPFTNN